VPIKYRARAGDTKLDTVKDGTQVMLQIFQKRLATLFADTSREREKQTVLTGEKQTVAG
jgi:hypothetical protein